ncbi:hypothetical protein DFH27DRAFT_611774 [Peziza echinospora]|nr:hypothetical protein DFH27DRAFT_611774 [Peziza echinospora]
MSPNDKAAAVLRRLEELSNAGQLLDPSLSLLLGSSSSSGSFNQSKASFTPSAPSTPKDSQLSSRGKRAFVPLRPMVLPKGGSSQYVSKVPTLEQYMKLSWREQLAIRMGSWGDRLETMNRAAAFKSAMQAHTNGINLDRPYEDYDYEHQMRPNLKRAQVKMEALYGWPSDLYVCTDLAIRLCIDKTRNEAAKQHRRLNKAAQGPKVVPETGTKRKASDDYVAKEMAELGINTSNKRRNKASVEIIDNSDELIQEDEEAEEDDGYIIRIKHGPDMKANLSMTYELFMSKIEPYFKVESDSFYWYQVTDSDGLVKSNTSTLGDREQYKQMQGRLFMAIDKCKKKDPAGYVVLMIKMNCAVDQNSDGESSSDESPCGSIMKPFSNIKRTNIPVVHKDKPAPAVVVPDTQPIPIIQHPRPVYVAATTQQFNISVPDSQRDAVIVADSQQDAVVVPDTQRSPMIIPNTQPAPITTQRILPMSPDVMVPNTQPVVYNNQSIDTVSKNLRFDVDVVPSTQPIAVMSGALTAKALNTDTAFISNMPTIETDHNTQATITEPDGFSETDPDGLGAKLLRYMGSPHTVETHSQLTDSQTIGSQSFESQESQVEQESQMDGSQMDESQMDESQTEMFEDGMEAAETDDRKNAKATIELLRFT